MRLLPYFRPGDPAMGRAVRELGGVFSAVLLSNHGPVVAGRSLETAGNAIEELEATARLELLTRNLPRRLLTPHEVSLLRDARETGQFTHS